jgi:acylphosphatase
MTDRQSEAPAQICMRCLVGGRVQGVFFRASTRHQAQTLGLSGHARNLSDGRVEVLVCGDPKQVAKLQSWLRQGPPMAEVSGLSCEPVPFRDLPDFSVG